MLSLYTNCANHNSPTVCCQMIDIFYWPFEVHKAYLSLEILLGSVSIIVYNKIPGCFISPYRDWYIKMFWPKCKISNWYLHSTFNYSKCCDPLPCIKTWQLYFLGYILLTHREAIHIFDFKTDKIGLFIFNSTLNGMSLDKHNIHLFLTMLHVYLIWLENLISLFT